MATRPKSIRRLAEAKKVGLIGVVCVRCISWCVVRWALVGPIGKQNGGVGWEIGLVEVVLDQGFIWILACNWLTK